MSQAPRIDKWLWAARFFKTRAMARDAIKGGKIQLKGQRVKPGRTLSAGDCLQIRKGEDEFQIEVVELGDRRVSATLAANMYIEDEASRLRREEAVKQRKLD